MFLSPKQYKWFQADILFPRNGNHGFLLQSQTPNRKLLSPTVVKVIQSWMFEEVSEVVKLTLEWFCLQLKYFREIFWINHLENKYIHSFTAGLMAFISAFWAF